MSKSNSHVDSHLDEQLAMLHGQVTQALKMTNHSCEEGSRQVVESAVHRARTKIRMLGGIVDSHLALNALQEARTEMAKLPDVSAATATNAALMQQLIDREKEIGVVDRDMSNITQVNEMISPSELDPRNNTDSSVVTIVTGGTVENPAGAVDASDTESTATSKYWSKAGEYVIKPMKQLVEEAKNNFNMKNDLVLNTDLSVKTNTNEQLKNAKDIDFEKCASPPAVPHTTKHLPFLRTPSKSSNKKKIHHVLDPSLDQFHPMSPRETRSTEKGATGATDANQGYMLEPRSGVEQASSRESKFPSNACCLTNEDKKTTYQSSAGIAPCDASIPPGLNPLGCVEGSAVTDYLDENLQRDEELDQDDMHNFKNESTSAGKFVDELSGKLGEICRVQM